MEKWENVELNEGVEERREEKERNVEGLGGDYGWGEAPLTKCSEQSMYTYIVYYICNICEYMIFMVVSILYLLFCLLYLFCLVYSV